MRLAISPFFFEMFIKYRPPSTEHRYYKRKVMELTKSNHLLQVQLEWMKKKLELKNDELEKAHNKARIMVSLLETEIDKVGLFSSKIQRCRIFVANQALDDMILSQSGS